MLRATTNDRKTARQTLGPWKVALGRPGFRCRSSLTRRTGIACSSLREIQRVARAASISVLINDSTKMTGWQAR